MYLVVKMSETNLFVKCKQQDTNVGQEGCLWVVSPCVPSCRQATLRGEYGSSALSAPGDADLVVAHEVDVTAFNIRASATSCSSSYIRCVLQMA